MFQFEKKNGVPMLLGSIHMPAFLYGVPQKLPELETWLLRNVEHFAEGGFDTVMIQDSTPCCPGLDQKALVYISALSYSVKRHFQEFPVGLIIESNDAAAALTIAAAADMAYIRSKVFIGAMQKPAGLVEGSARQAFHYRKIVDRDVAICADILDRMGAPLGERDFKLAISQAKKYGADAVILTGSSFDETCRLLDAAEKSFPALPRLAGGGIDETNILAASAHCDGMVVSSCLTKDGCKNEWDREKISRLAAMLKE